jgi:hypothetical protein
LRQLGWEIDVRLHDGFTGGIDPAAHGGQTFYWYTSFFFRISRNFVFLDGFSVTDVYRANHICEVVYHVATMMPNGDPKNAQVLFSLSLCIMSCC